MNPTILRELINEIVILSRLLGSDRSPIKGLTSKQLHIMMEIGQHTYKHGELAIRLRVDSSTLTRTLEPLVKKGMVDRKTNPSNRREVLIRLTNIGIDNLKKVNHIVDQHCAQILKSVPSDKLEMVQTSIQILLEIMKHKETVE